MRRRSFLQKLAMIGGGAATLAATGRAEALPRKLEPKLKSRAIEIFRANQGVDVRDLKERANALCYWSRAPGVFVNKETGVKVELSSAASDGPKFTGTVREWYETLIEMIIDVGNKADGIRYEWNVESGPLSMHVGPKKVPDIPDAEGTVYVSRDLLTIIEQTTLYRANYHRREDGSIDISGGGVIYNRYTVLPTNALKRNELLVFTDRGNVGLLTVLDMNILDL